MTTPNQSSPHTTPTQRVAQLTADLAQRDRLDMRIQALAEDLFTDIISGNSTGDVCTDFSLALCDGLYLQEVVQEYWNLCNYFMSHDNQLICIMQEAVHTDDEVTLGVRNFYIAKVRADAIAFNIDELTLGLPVQPDGYLFSKLMYTKDERIICKHAYFTADRLYVGPLWNEYTRIGPAESNQSCSFAPHHATFTFFAHPWNYAVLENTMVSREFIADLMQRYMRMKTKANTPISFDT